MTWATAQSLAPVGVSRASKLHLNLSVLTFVLLLRYTLPYTHALRPTAVKMELKNFSNFQIVKL